MTDSTPSPPSTASPSIDEPNTIISISTTFSPDSEVAKDSDLVLASTDGVYFFVHRSKLLDASTNSFGGLLLPLPENKAIWNEFISGLGDSPMAEDAYIHDPTIGLHSIASASEFDFSTALDPNDQLPEVLLALEPSSSLNIVLHVLYGLPMEKFQPDLQLLCYVLSALVAFGYRPANLVVPQSEIFQLLVAHSKSHPLAVYALAASHKIECLAVSCSPNTLRIELSELTDELAIVMGPIYAKRLFFLHLGRSDALKRLLLEPPIGHPPSPICDLEDQKCLTRAWALTTAYMALEGRPDTHPEMLSSSLGTLGNHLKCPGCRTSLSDRVRLVVQRWAAVRDTI